MKVLSLDTKNKIAKVTSLRRYTFINILSDTVMKTEQNIYETFGYIEKKVRGDYIINLLTFY